MMSQQPQTEPDELPAAETSPPGLCISLFGTFSVWLGHHELSPAAFPRRKALHLFKLIALQPDHQLHRDQILDLLWPHLAPHSAAAQLYKAIHHIRQTFTSTVPSCPPDGLLRLSGEVLHLQAPAGVHTDIARFTQLVHKAKQTRDPDLLQQAVACYKGDILLADRYEEWTFPCRTDLQEQLLDVLKALGQILLELGRLAEAADTFRQILARDETHEDAHHNLMKIYALQGSRARALRQYQQCATILVREVGIEPSPATTELYEQILNGAIQSAPPSDTPPLSELVLLTPLIGRRTVRYTVDERLQCLNLGQGSVLALEGPMGIGKTRLAQEIQQQMDRQMHVLWGSVHAEEGQSPYMPVIEALRKAIRHDPSDAHLIPAELAVAIPELPPTTLPVTSADRVAAQNALFAGVLRFLAARAKQAPVILILDDLHAADSGTWKLFHYLARHVGELPLLLVGIWRTDEPEQTTGMTSTISSLARQNVLHRVTLSPLSSEDHHLLLEQALEGGHIDATLAGALYRLSAGNPLYTKEMVRQLVTDELLTLINGTWHLHPDFLAGHEPSVLPIPASVQALFSSRLASLTPAALRLLQFAAVMGQDIPIPLLEVWSGLGEHGVPETTLLDALDAAAAAGILEERGFSYRFVHPIFRHVVYRQMSTMRRRALHEQAAVGLERLAPPAQLALPIEAIAFHYRQAGNTTRAVHFLIQAGDRAESLYDHDGALDHYQEALALLSIQQSTVSVNSVAQLHERIGDVHCAAGNVVESLQSYQQACELLDRSAAGPDQQCALHRKVTHAAVLTPDMPTAAEHLQKAWALSKADAPLAKARMLITQALFDWHANQLEAAIEHAAEALKIAELEDAHVEISQACEMLAIAHLPLGRWEEGLHYELRRHTPDWSPEIVVAVDAHLCLYQFRIQGSEPYRQVTRFIQQVAEQASNVGNLRCMAVCHFVLGSLALLQGEPELASKHLTESLELHQRVGSPSCAAYTLSRQIDLLTIAGELDAGWKCVQMGLDVASQAAIRDHCTMMVHASGIWNRLAAADLAHAAQLVELARQHEAESTPCAICSVDRHASVAAYFVAAGDFDKATDYVDQALQLAQASQNRLGQARALRVQGQIDAAHNNPAAAERNLTEAAAIFLDLNSEYDLAQTWLVWGNLPANEESLQQERKAKQKAAQELLSRFQVGLVLPADMQKWTYSSKYSP